MKKKLISLLLCFVMLFSFTMTSCSTEEENPTQQTEKDTGAVTLVWALVCDEVPSEEVQSAISTAVNKITESRYTTHVVLEFYETENYAETIEEKLVQNQIEAEKASNAKKAWKKYLKANKVGKLEDGSTYQVDTEDVYEMFCESFPDYAQYVELEESTEETSETEAETTTNEYGVNVIAYPEATENQIDILYISGYDNYIRYINNEWLAALDNNLAEDSKEMTKSIFSAFLDAAETVYGTYAVPNNNTIGDYTYLLLNKELTDKYYYVPEDITGLTTSLCQNFLYDVANFEGENYVPLLYNDATRSVQNVMYWNVEYTTDEYDMVNSQTLLGDFSPIGCLYSKSVTQETISGNSIYQCMLLLNDSAYVSQLKTLKQYECDGYYGAEENETRPFAAGIVVGDMVDLVPKYSDEYYMIVVDYPHGTAEELYKNMWAVSAYCTKVDRAMEIITYLNTNADFRNLIQYGVEGKHYTYNSLTGLVTRAKDANDNYYYSMDINKTGNVFLAYPEVGMNADAWTYGKLQNQEALIDLRVGFTVSTVIDDTLEIMLNQEGMDAVIKWAERYAKDYANFETVADIDTYMSGFSLAAGTDISSLTVIQKTLLEYNGITSSEKTTMVKGALALMKEDEHLVIMMDGNYAPGDTYSEEEDLKNRDYYGYGESLMGAYYEWAINMKFLKISSGD